MIVKNFKFKTIKSSLIAIISCGLFCGCSSENNMSPENQWNKISINACIEQLHMNYEDIHELTCNPSDNVSLLSMDYDLLEKLVNLETIKLVGIGSEDDAQKFFSELTKLKKLKTVEIVDSHIGSIDQLGDIENLVNLSIIGNIGGGVWFGIEDIELLESDERFDELQSLSIKFINLDKIPNLKKLKKLDSLAVSGQEITSINENTVNWNQLTSLEISNTSVSSIDSDIVKQLKKLRLLDISYSKFKNVNFVNELPELDSFKYAGYSTYDANVACLKKHPNYKDNWLND